MKNKKTNVLKILIIGVILAALVIGYYYYLSNIKTKPDTSAETAKATKVQEVLMKDLEKSYPPTPKELVRYYSELTVCVHNEEYTEEEFQKLAERMHELYDDELAEKNPIDKYKEDLRFDVNSMREKKYVISSYKTSSSTDVEYYTGGGREYAQIYCSYTMRLGTTLGYIDEVFVLRKDDDGHWKILGFDLDKQIAALLEE